MSAISISKAISGVERLFLDTAPLIYFLEENIVYLDRVKTILEKLNAGQLEGFTSVVTLTEVLPLPMKSRDSLRISKHQDFLLRSQHLAMISIDIPIAIKAAELQSSYNLRTPDALQLAAALSISTDAFLTMINSYDV